MLENKLNPRKILEPPNSPLRTKRKVGIPKREARNEEQRTNERGM